MYSIPVGLYPLFFIMGYLLRRVFFAKLGASHTDLIIIFVLVIVSIVLQIVDSLVKRRK